MGVKDGVGVCRGVDDGLLEGVVDGSADGAVPLGEEERDGEQEALGAPEGSNADALGVIVPAEGDGDSVADTVAWGLLEGGVEGDTLLEGVMDGVLACDELGVGVTLPTLRAPVSLRCRMTGSAPEARQTPEPGCTAMPSAADRYRRPWAP